MPDIDAEIDSILASGQSPPINATSLRGVHSGKTMFSGENTDWHMKDAKSWSKWVTPRG